MDNPRTQIRRVHPSRTISLPHQVGVVQRDHDYYHTIHETKIQGSRNHKVCADWSCCGLVQRALYRSSYSISFYLTSITPRSLSHSKSSYCILENKLYHSVVRPESTHSPDFRKEIPPLPPSVNPSPPAILRTLHDPHGRLARNKTEASSSLSVCIRVTTTASKMSRKPQTTHGTIPVAYNARPSGVSIPPTSNA